MHLAFLYLGLASLMVLLVVRLWTERLRRSASDTIMDPEGTCVLRLPDQRGQGILLAAAFFFLAVAAPGGPWTHGEATLAIVLFALTSVLGIVVAIRSGRVVARIDRDGIEIVGLFSRSAARWKDITSVTYSKWSAPWLILHTAEGSKLSISMDWQGSNGLLFLLEEILPTAVVDQRVSDMFPGH